MTQKQMTPEIRYKIFAPYIGCEVSGTRHEEPAKGYLTGLTQQYGDFDAEIQRIEGYHTAEEADFRPVNEVSLLLKPLSSISDVDAVEIFNISKKWKSWMYRSETPKLKKGLEIVRDLINDGCYWNPKMLLAVSDFLRSKGYALGYLDYSISDLVEAGVYKLQNR